MFHLIDVDCGSVPEHTREVSVQRRQAQVVATEKKEQVAQVKAVKQAEKQKKRAACQLEAGKLTSLRNNLGHEGMLNLFNGAIDEARTEKDNSPNIKEDANPMLKVHVHLHNTHFEFIDILSQVVSPIMSTLRSNLTTAINKSDHLLKIAPKQSFSHPPPLQLSSALERVATLAPSATKPISTFTIGEVADRLHALRAEKKYLAGQHFDFIFLTVLFTVGRLLLERQSKLTQESSPTELQAEFMRICKEMARRGQLPPELGPLPTLAPHTGLSHTSLVFLYDSHFLLHT